MATKLSFYPILLYFGVNLDALANMKKFTLLFSLLCGCFSLYAQQKQQTNKLDAQLKLWVSNPKYLIKAEPGLFKKGPVNDPMIPVIAKVSADAKTIVSKYHGVVFSVIGDICTAELPLSQVIGFANDARVMRIESAKEIRLHNDKAKELTGADKVQTAQLPEGQAYTGKDVLVGVIDTGIDFLHPDFREKTDSTKTRIRAIWDQTLNDGTHPAQFNYGSEWDSAQLQAALTLAAPPISQRDSSGHGTHVTGSAAGLRGVAYDAEIIMVKTPLVSNGDYRFSTSAKTLDAVKYIYDKAAALGKPCVVNMSLGFAFGTPHDGTSLFEQGIDLMVNERKGFIVCASAGNDGRDFIHHGGYALTADSSWSYINGLNGATWYAASNKTYDDSIFYSIVMDSAMLNFSTGLYAQKKMFQTPWFSVSELKNAAGGLNYDILYGNGDTAASLKIIASDYDLTRSEVYVYARDKSVLVPSGSGVKVNLFKVAVRGAGSFHSWVQALNGYSVNMPDYGALTNARFKPNDNIYCIGIPATGKRVFAVGAFVNKKNYTDILGRTQQGLNTSNASVGAAAFFTSKGPTTDNRVKPDFSAPGLNVASSLSRYAEKDSSQIVDQYTAVYSGTSMSCPISSGCIALLLQKSPYSDFDDIKKAIDSATVKDVFVKAAGPVPNNTWGYGKLNIFEAMKLPLTGIGNVRHDNSGVSVYPNPATSSFQFSFIEPGKWKHIYCYDVNGKLVAELPVSSHTFIDVSEWKEGMYFYRVSGQNTFATGKIFIQK